MFSHGHSRGRQLPGSEAGEAKGEATVKSVLTGSKKAVWQGFSKPKGRGESPCLGVCELEALCSFPWLLESHR